MKLKSFFLLIVLFLWCGVIFYASSRTSVESNGRSKEIIYGTVKKFVVVTNKFNITNIDLSDDRFIKSIVNDLNYPLRKCVHVLVYFVLAIILMFCLKNFNIGLDKVFVINIILCFFYSMLDEYHQMFIRGRTGQFSDCLVDGVGILLGSLFMYRFFLVKNNI